MRQANVALAKEDAATIRRGRGSTAIVIVIIVTTIGSTLHQRKAAEDGPAHAVAHAQRVALRVVRA